MIHSVMSDSQTGASSPISFHEFWVLLVLDSPRGEREVLVVLGLLHAARLSLANCLNSLVVIVNVELMGCSVVPPLLLTGTATESDRNHTL